MGLMWWYPEEGKLYKCEVGMRNAECGMRNGECGMRNGECGMRNAECGMRNAECGIMWERLLAAKFTVYARIYVGRATAPADTKKEHRALKGLTSNIEHPTSNVEWQEENEIAIRSLS